MHLKIVIVIVFNKTRWKNERNNELKKLLDLATFPISHILKTDN